MSKLQMINAHVLERWVLFFQETCWRKSCLPDLTLNTQSDLSWFLRSEKHFSSSVPGIQCHSSKAHCAAKEFIVHRHITIHSKIHLLQLHVRSKVRRMCYWSWNCIHKSRKAPADSLLEGLTWRMINVGPVGHKILQMRLSKEKFASEYKKAPVFAQFSSLGSLDQKWLHQEFQQTLSSGFCQSATGLYLFLL